MNLASTLLGRRTVRIYNTYLTVVNRCEIRAGNADIQTHALFHNARFARRHLDATPDAHLNHYTTNN